MLHSAQRIVLAIAGIVLFLAATLLTSWPAHPATRNRISTPLVKTGHSTKAAAQNSPDSVPLHVVNAVPKQLQLLRPGMSPTEVWRTLDLAEYQDHLSAVGGGPFGDYRTCYFLRDTGDFKVILVFDVRDSNGRLDLAGGVFKRASLAGHGWDTAQLEHER